jgi:hypothetical protein
MSDRELECKYSGYNKSSVRFWKRINKLPEPNKSALYNCGVLLQNLEVSVLRWLSNAEIVAKIKRRSK